MEPLHRGAGWTLARSGALLLLTFEGTVCLEGIEASAGALEHLLTQHQQVTWLQVARHSTLRPPAAVLERLRTLFLHVGARVPTVVVFLEHDLLSDLTGSERLRRLSHALGWPLTVVDSLEEALGPLDEKLRRTVEQALASS